MRFYFFSISIIQGTKWVKRFVNNMKVCFHNFIYCTYFDIIHVYWRIIFPNWQRERCVETASGQENFCFWLYPRKSCEILNFLGASASVKYTFRFWTKRWKSFGVILNEGGGVCREDLWTYGRCGTMLNFGQSILSTKEIKRWNDRSKRRVYCWKISI